MTPPADDERDTGSTKGLAHPDPTAALDRVEEFLDRFVAWPNDHARVAATLWVAHTYLIDQFESTPRLALLSPEPGSGKTRALEVIGSLVRRPMHAIHCTPAALFRAAGDADNRPTILFDEIDTIFGPKAKENEEVRGFLNAGHRRSGVTYRCETIGHRHQVVAFPSFTAVALAGLHDLPDTIASRSIIVRMRRRGPGESVEAYRTRMHEPQGLAIGEYLAAAVVGLHVPAEPVLPGGVTDRPADVWEPLLGVAQAVGGAWPPRAAEACSHFVLEGSWTREPSVSVLLLTDLRHVFHDAGDAHALATATILTGLHRIEESPWRDLRGRPLDPASLARRLRQYGIRSVNLRQGASVVKGYRRADLMDAWSRYLPEADPGGECESDPGEAISDRDATSATAPPPRPIASTSRA